MLQQKKKGNKCDGFCAGTQYFNCLPGYGVFTTIDKINLQNSPLVTSKTNSAMETDLYSCLEKNVSSLMSNGKLKNEEIVTRFGEYSPKIASTTTTTTNNYMRNSQSLQNILDLGSNAANSNNDFDQNTIVQTDKIQLINDKKAKMKSELNLSDLVGTAWHGASDSKELEKFSNLNKTLERQNGHNNINNNKDKNSRNRSVNVLSHFYDSTLPKRNKVAVPTAKFYSGTLPRLNGISVSSSTQEGDKSKFFLLKINCTRIFYTTPINKCMVQRSIS